MPHSEHRKKTLRKAREANAVNRTRRSSVRTVVKKARAAVAEGKATPESLVNAIKNIDKAAEYGVYHPNKAARLKSRLARAANRAQSSTKPGR